MASLIILKYDIPIGKNLALSPSAKNIISFTKGEDYANNCPHAYMLNCTRLVSFILLVPTLFILLASITWYCEIFFIDEMQRSLGIVHLFHNGGIQTFSKTLINSFRQQS